MSEMPPSSPAAAEQEVPWELWWFGWSFVAAGVVQMLTRGLQDDAASVVVSVALSALVAVVFADGVVRARGFRLGVVAVLVGLVLVAAVAGLTVDPTVLGAATAGFAALHAWLLWRYTRTPWFAWQRTRPAAGPSLTPVLTVAVLAGVVGGLTAPADVRPGFQVNISAAGDR